MSGTGKLYRTLKRGFDAAGSAALLVLTSPAFLVISVLIRKESPGPVFYVHDRIGQNGKHIKVYKFRSMEPGADELESILNDEDMEEYYQEFKLKSDPRVTEIGRRLRRSSLDELPQLLNVIAGNMSLVGPRPVMEEELKYYSDEREAGSSSLSDREKFLSSKPGITGYWQVNGRNSATYLSGRRQEMELYYAEHASLLLDALILLRTPAALFRRKGC